MLSVVDSVLLPPGLPVPGDSHIDTGLYGELRTHLAPLSYDRGTQLCLEGHPAAGIFGICTGTAKEYLTSKRGKTAILRIAAPGDLIGLESVIEGTGYPTTVEALEDMTAYFITKRDFLGSMRCDEEFRLTVAKQLSNRCRSAYSGLRRFWFRASVPARIARFLLRSQQDSTTGTGNPGIQMSLTHEEIGQAIGTARETVSRIISSFRRRGWIQVAGGRWRIVNRARLAALAAQHCGFEG